MAKKKVTISAIDTLAYQTPQLVSEKVIYTPEFIPPYDDQGIKFAGYYKVRNESIPEKWLIVKQRRNKFSYLFGAGGDQNRTAGATRFLCTKMLLTIYMKASFAGSFQLSLKNGGIADPTILSMTLVGDQTYVQMLNFDFTDAPIEFNNTNGKIGFYLSGALGAGEFIQIRLTGFEEFDNEKYVYPTYRAYTDQ